MSETIGVTQYWVVQWSCFARVCAQEVERGRSITSGMISEYALLHAVYNNGSSIKNWEAVQKMTGEVSLCRFLADQICEFVEENAFGASYSTSNKLLLVARHILTTDPQKRL